MGLLGCLTNDIDSLYPRWHDCILDGANRSNREKESMVKITTIGIDLDKTKLRVHGADDNGKMYCVRACHAASSRVHGIPRSVPGGIELVVERANTRAGSLRGDIGLD